MRGVIDRALAAGLTPAEKDAVLVVLREVGTYSRTSDVLPVGRVAERLGVGERQAGRLLGRVHQKGVLVYRAGQGAGKVSTVELPTPEKVDDQVVHFEAEDATESGPVSPDKWTSSGEKVDDQVVHPTSRPSEETSEERARRLVTRAQSETAAVVHQRRHHGARLDAALAELADAGRSFTWPSELAKALDVILGRPAPSTNGHHRPPVERQRQTVERFRREVADAKTDEERRRRQGELDSALLTLEALGGVA